MGKYLSKLMIATIVFCLSVGGGLAVAQDEEIEDEFTLEEITVTAQKREENQQKVSIAMEVVTGEDLVVMGRSSVDEILKDISNVFINTSNDGMRITLRGITDDSRAESNQHVADSAVALNIDGAYNNMNNAGQDLYDIERVEVLFGPQSTMYGSNAPGGVVNVVTASPKTDKYSANATVEYGSYDLLNLQGVLNVPVIQDKVALRLAANKSKQDSYVEGDSKSDTTSARLKALYQATNQLSISVTGNWSERASAGMMGGSVKPFGDQDGYYADGTKVTDPWTPAEDDDSGGGGGGPGGPGEGGETSSGEQTTKGLSANIDWSTPFGNISAVPSYSESESESEGENNGNATYTQDSNTQKGGELRMTNATDFEWFQWIFGGTYYESEQSRHTQSAGSADEGRDTVSKKSALYANITYPLWFYDKFALILGYRQSWDKNYSTEYGTPMSGTTGNPEQESEPDFRYGFQWDAADNLMVYGNYSSSYRSPNAMAPGGSKAEELDSYSLGAKSRWLDNRLQVNVSAYYYDYANKLCSGWKEASDITEYDLGGDYISIGEPDREGNPAPEATPDGEYPTLDPITGEPFVFTIHDSQAQGYGAFTSLGLDLQTTWIITSKDRLNLSISYLDSEWKDLHFRYEWYMYWPDEDYEGVTPVNSPKWSMTASYQHNFMLGALGTLTPRIDVQHKSEYTMLWNPGDADQYGYSYQEGYVTYDASAAFNHSSGRWTLNAYVKNITNYAVKRSYQGRTGSEELRIGDPRTYGVTFSIQF